MTNEQFNNNYDVFHAFLVENADFEGKYEMPVIKTSDLIPNRIVNFSSAMSKSWTDFDCFVMFYEHDAKFERLWNKPKAYLDRLKKFKGVISPDFSLYRNMPGVGYGKGFRKPKEEVLVGKNKWISKRDWKNAITARQNGTATKKQKEWLDNGHWKD